MKRDAMPPPNLRGRARLRLPSGQVVELLDWADSTRGTVWHCGYVRRGVLTGSGAANSHRLVLRADWLRRYGMEVAG